MRNMRRISEKYEFTLDGRQISLIFFLIVLLIGLSFSIGVMYGKGLRKIEKPEIVVQEERTPEPLVPPDSVATTQPAQGGSETRQVEEKKEDYTFYNTLTEKTPPPGIEGKTEETKEVVIPPPVEEQKSVEEKPKQEETKKKEQTKGEYAIQVIAYNDRDKARSMVKKLNSKGFNAFIEEGKSGNKRIFRVKIGYYTTKEEAERAIKELKKRENLTGFITK